MKNTYDLIGLGELLIDFTPVKDAKETYKANPGGAPGNVVCTIQKYGYDTGFIGSIGRDHFGELLCETLANFGVDVSLIEKIDEAFTTMAFVSLDENGDRSFSFARKPGADTLLTLTEQHKKALSKTKILHFGTISMSHKNNRAATKEAVELVRTKGGIISFDPNLRLNLWDSKEELMEQVEWGLKHSDILKMSSEDMADITECDNDMYFIDLFKNTDLKLILHSVGENGAYAISFDRENNALIKAHADIATNIYPVDTTGAGDIFTGAFLSKLLDALNNLEANTEIEKLESYLNSKPDFHAALSFANLVAGTSTMSMGGIPSIPDFDKLNI